MAERRRTPHWKTLGDWKSEPPPRHATMTPYRPPRPVAFASQCGVCLLSFKKQKCFCALSLSRPCCVARVVVSRVACAASRVSEPSHSHSRLSRLCLPGWTGPGEPEPAPPSAN